MEELFPTQLPPYPICEKKTRDMYEKLYRLSEKRYVLDINGQLTLLSRSETLEWLKSHKMSRATMF